MLVVGRTCNPSPRVSVPNGCMATADNHDVVPRHCEALVVLRRPTYCFARAYVRFCLQFTRWFSSCNCW
jgi:hypothetical protein